MNQRSLSGAAPLPPVLDGFLRELSIIGDEHVRPVREAFRALQDEALDVDDAESLMVVLTRLACLPRSLLERLNAISDVLAQRGRVSVALTRDNYRIERPS
jgi:hypothetical protein